MMMNWAALGEPRLDGSDVAPLLRRLRIPPRTDLFSLQAVSRALDFEPKNKPFLSADPNGVPAGASTLLQAWPEIWRTAEEMLVALYPCFDPRYANKSSVVGGSYGCKSASVADFGHIYASTTSPAAFVEGIVSSLANWKLYALGFQHREWDQRLFDRPFSETYPNPLRPAEQVAAGVVIHVTYCVAHILVYYRQIAKLTPPPFGVQYMIQESQRRLERGRGTIRSMIGFAGGGFEKFIESFLIWSDRLLRENT